MARLLGGLICDSQLGTRGAGVCLSPGKDMGLTCLAGEVGSAMALGSGQAPGGGQSRGCVGDPGSLEAGSWRGMPGR